MPGAIEKKKSGAIGTGEVILMIDFFRILGCAELGLLFIYLITIIRKYGILAFLDLSKISFILWLGAYGLYNLRISSILHPNLIINIVGLVIIANFYVLSLCTNNINEIKKLGEGIIFEKISGTYSALIFCLTGIGFLSFYKTYNTYGFPLLRNNKLMRTELVYGYFFYTLCVSAIYWFYRIIKKHKVFNSIVLLAFTIGMMTFLLNRGLLFFALCGIMILIVLVYYGKTKRKYFSRTIFLALLSILGIGVYFFGKFGDMRFEYVQNTVYHMRFVQLYGLSADFPSGIGQIYMYLVSPLDNMADILQNQPLDFHKYNWFCNLFYPFIKVFANLFGLGNEFRDYFGTLNDITPYLQEVAGLNAMSFMADAYNDFGILGIFVYVFLYDVIFVCSKYMLNLRMGSISKIIIYSLMMQIALWSVFTDSVFRLATLWVDIFIVFIIDKISRKIRIKSVRANNSRTGAVSNV